MLASSARCRSAEAVGVERERGEAIRGNARQIFAGLLFASELGERPAVSRDP
jgi:hypothetical protein